MLGELHDGRRRERLGVRRDAEPVGRRQRRAGLDVGQPVGGRQARARRRGARRPGSPAPGRSRPGTPATSRSRRRRRAPPDVRGPRRDPMSPCGRRSVVSAIAERAYGRRPWGSCRCWTSRSSTTATPRTPWSATAPRARSAPARSATAARSSSTPTAGVDPAILDAYERTGFYVFEGVLDQDELDDIERDVIEILDRAPVTKGADDRPPRPPGPRRRRPGPQHRLGQAAVGPVRRHRAPRTAATRRR